jgi:hypothetical protein
MIVHRSVYTTSEQYVLAFRRGRFDVEVDLTEAPDTASDHAVAIARRVDGRLQATGRGLP